MDREFLEKLRSGDGEAFRSLVASFQEGVVRLCYRFLRNMEDAEDTAQEVFVEAFRNLSRFRAESEVSTWLYRIATNKSLDALRRKSRQKRQDGPPSFLPETAVGEPVAAAESSDPGRVLEAKERSRVLRQAIASLPKKQRIAVTLARFEGLGNKEIAEFLSMSAVSIDSLIFRAQKNLRKRLTRYYTRRFKSR